MSKVKCSSYSTAEKFQVLQYAKQHEEYNEAETNLKAWIFEFRQDGIAITPKIVKHI
nr:5825_t:CDS:2 [Entrophospora candida]CAG8569616.1 3442_t:CDS:2 [Entrophospora candida]